MKQKKLYVDQYGSRYYAKTVKELKEQLSASRAEKMYVTRGNDTYHVGYVIKGHWLTAYTPCEVKV